MDTQTIECCWSIGKWEQRASLPYILCSVPMNGIYAGSGGESTRIPQIESCNDRRADHTEIIKNSGNTTIYEDFGTGIIYRTTIVEA